MNGSSVQRGEPLDSSRAANHIGFMQAEMEAAQACETPAEPGPGRPLIITMPVVEKIAKLIAKGMTDARLEWRVEIGKRIEQLDNGTEDG